MEILRAPAPDAGALLVALRDHPGEGHVPRRRRAALTVAQHPIIICSQYLRPYLREFVGRFVPQIVVLSYGEVSQAAAVRTVATIRADEFVKAPPVGMATPDAEPQGAAS